MTNKKIKIFVDAHVFDGVFQGSRTFLLGLYSELSKQSDLFEIYLAANDIENLEKEFSGCDGLKFLQLKTHSKYMRLAFEIPSILKKGNFDYAHFTYISPIRKYCKYIITIHDLLFVEFPSQFPLSYRLKNYFLFRLSASKANVLTTISEYSRKSIANSFKINIDRIELIKIAVDSVFFVPYAKHKSQQFIFQKYGVKDYIIYVSRVEPRKNHLFLLKAYVELELWKQGKSLVFVGKDAIKCKGLDTYLNALSDEIRKNIYHFQNVLFEDLIEFYRAADLSVYPSKGEGFGIPPLEAAAMRVRSFCSNTTSMAEFNVLGNDLFDPSDLSELKEKLAAFYDGNCDKDMDHVSENILEQYNWGDISRQFGTVIVSDNMK